MLLTYDDIPGSWANYSNRWPTLHCKSENQARRAFVACTKEKVVPYGSYVLVGLDLRVETQEFLVRLKQHLAETTVHDADEVIRMYEDIELPLHCYDSGVDLSIYLKSDSWQKLQKLRKERQ